MLGWGVYKLTLVTSFDMHVQSALTPRDLLEQRRVSIISLILRHKYLLADDGIADERSGVACCQTPMSTRGYLI